MVKRLQDLSGLLIVVVVLIAGLLAATALSSSLLALQSDADSSSFDSSGSIGVPRALFPFSLMGEYAYRDADGQESPGTAYARAKLMTTEVFDADDTGAPYYENASVRARCTDEADDDGLDEYTLYVYRNTKAADDWAGFWNEADCDRDGCKGYDEISKYSDLRGGVIYELQEGPGPIPPATFVCYAYDEDADGSWAYIAVARSFYGGEIVERPVSQDPVDTSEPEDENSEDPQPSDEQSEEPQPSEKNWLVRFFESVGSWIRGIFS